MCNILTACHFAQTALNKKCKIFTPDFTLSVYTSYTIPNNPPRLPANPDVKTQRAIPEMPLRNEPHSSLLAIHGAVTCLGARLVKFSLHRWIAPRQAFDSKRISLVIGKTEIILGT